MTWTILLYRDENGIHVVFLSDISKDGEKPDQAFWVFAELIQLIEEGKLHILRFNLLDVQVHRIWSSLSYFGIICFWYINTELYKFDICNILGSGWPRIKSRKEL